MHTCTHGNGNGGGLTSLQLLGQNKGPKSSISLNFLQKPYLD